MVVADHPLSELGTITTLLLKRSPFSRAELERVRRTIRGSRSMTPLYLPDERLGTPFVQLLRAEDPDACLRAYAFDITPVHHNRPFFFFNVRTGDVLRLSRIRYGMDLRLNLSILLLFGVLLLSAGGVLLFLVMPARLSGRLPQEPGVRRWLLYFSAIGLAYILVEVAFIRKFVLFLGHPTYALTVAVFWLLAASGCGSFWSRRFPEEALEGYLPRLLLVVAGVIGLLVGAVTPLLTALGSWPLAGRVAISALLLAPVGFLMGMAFPIGLRLTGRAHAGVLQWAWAINAAASVLGSALAVFISIHLGIWQTLAAGGLCYLLAAALAGYGAGRASSSRMAASTVSASVSPT